MASAIIKNEITDKSDFWIQDTKSGYIYHITEGAGDALEEEDIEQGYVDYIYYDYYESLNDIHEDSAYDGGMILLKKAYQDMSLEEIIKELEDFENCKFSLERSN